ncbi:MAG TPA: response regulator [Candidatus Acidoferrum sp.]
MQSRPYQILFVGDSAQAKVVLQLLRDAEESIFDVTQEENWQAALSQIAFGGPDAVVWDLPAGGVDILGHLKEARSRNNSLPLLVLVSESDKQLGTQAVKAGACDYLLKETLNKDFLRKVLQYLIEGNRAENMLRQSQKLEAIGRLSGGLAHDFNNLLCVISGHTELLTEALGSNDPALRSVTQIRKAADSAAALTRQLLAFSRRQVFHPQVVDLNAIVVETERLLARLIDEHIEFYTALDPALDRVLVDPIQIEQVIINLVLNARDAMPQGGKLSIETSSVALEEDHHSRLSHIPAGKYVLLAMTDTGCGMNEETQSRIFEPFYTTKEMGKGTGLGLATVYGIVKQSGGFIWVYSEEGRGTTFKLYLPRVVSPLTEACPSEQQREIGKGTETILLVEDAEPLRALTKEFLTDSGYTVLEAANGDEALQIAQSYSGAIDLLLTDVVMPRMGGKLLVEQMARIRPGTQVLYMSGYPNDGMVQAGILANRVTLLEKPFTREILAKRVRQVLDASPREPEPGSTERAQTRGGRPPASS